MSNVKEFEGDVTSLPHCKVCKDEEGNPLEYAEDAKHDYLTQEHPYEMLSASEPDADTESGPEQV